MWEVLFDRYFLFLLVFARLAGMLLTNPVLSQRQVPAMLRMGLSLSVAALITPVLPAPAAAPSSPVSMLLLFGKELAIGCGAGFVFSLTMSAVLMAGEIIDSQLGMSMARIYDPQSSISMPLTGNLYYLMFGVLFFSADGHLQLIKTLVLSFAVLPPGSALIQWQSGNGVAALFGSMLSLALRMALPVIAAELLGEMGLGVLMRTVPQINIFAAGIQLKLLIGVTMVLLLITGTGSLIGLSVERMFGSMQQLIEALA